MLEGRLLSNACVAFFEDHAWGAWCHESDLNLPAFDPPPPTYDPAAVLRWQAMQGAVQTPWLHQEVGRRMLERLQWFRRKPKQWTHWSPALSGAELHRQLVQVCGSQVSLWEPQALARARMQRELAPAWWQRWRRSGRPLWSQPADASQDMVWANLVPHTHLQPLQLLRRWHELLRVDGFVMFSCLGPDTAIEIRTLYQQLGWAPAAADLTDMHDWGDMLVRCGFAEPVMDMERLTLTFSTAQALLAELRQWGRNVHPERFGGLRGRVWAEALHQALEREGPRDSAGRLCLSLELVYGHALRPAPRWKADAVSTVAVEDLRRSLQQTRPR